MRRVIIILMLSLSTLDHPAAQRIAIETFKRELAKPQEDRRKLILYSELTLSYGLTDKFDSSTFQATKARNLPQKSHAPLEEANALLFWANTSMHNRIIHGLQHACKAPLRYYKT